MAAPEANARAGSGGSYLVMQQMKESYAHHVGSRLTSPSTRQALRFGTGQYLHTELQKLQLANAKLNAKLAFAANRVPGLTKLLGMEASAAEHQHEGGGAAHDNGKAGDSAQGSGLPALVLDDLLLAPEEVQEASMRCCWLARYWTLAEQLGICEDIAHEKAAYWRSLSLPLASYFQCAKAAAAPYVPIKPSTARPAAAEAEQLQAAADAAAATVAAPPTNQISGPVEHHVVSGGGATIADIVELERGLRQLAELGVVQEVLATLMHRRQATLAAQIQAGVDGHTEPSSPKGAAADDSRHGSSSAIAATEAQEVAFQRAWLAYVWARAASLGIEPQVCKQKAEHWGHLLLWDAATEGVPAQQQPAQQQQGLPLHAKELLEVHAGQQELARLGVEQQLWQRRCS